MTSLTEQLPPGSVSTHHGELLTKAHDRWSLAMLRETRGDRVPPPFAVVLPASTEEVAAVLQWARRTGTAIVPRGGGSGMSGGAQALKRSVVLDTSRMNRILRIDDISQTVQAEAGVRIAQLEAALVAHGLTTGHHPDTPEASTLGGWIAGAPPGAAWAGYGEVAGQLLGLKAVTGSGDVIRLEPVPRPELGVDPRRLLPGSQGTLAVITEATLAAYRRPAGYEWEVLRPNSFESGAALVREVINGGFHPLVLTLHDDAEAAASFASLGYGGGPALIAGFDAATPALTAQRSALRQLSKEMGARPLPAELAEHWWDHRSAAVELYDGIMGQERSFGPGVMAETMEIAGFWRRLPRLYADVRSALFEDAESVRCKLFRAYPAGASLRFSIVLHAGSDRDAEGSYRRAWERAATACKGAQGTLALPPIGLLKAGFLAEELGEGGLSYLRNMMAGVDPGGVLNPGKLLPADRASSP